MYLSSIFLNFNTSHVSVQDTHHKAFDKTSLFQYISCISSSAGAVEDALGVTLFQYISCISSSKNGGKVERWLSYFNTSHVSVQETSL